MNSAVSMQVFTFKVDWPHSLAATLARHRFLAFAAAATATKTTTTTTVTTTAPATTSSTQLKYLIINVDGDGKIIQYLLFIE